MHNCCNNYTRSQLLRSAAAEAGKGLPAIEPGMPEPGRDRALAAQLPLLERRPRARRLRRLEDPAGGLRGGDRAGGARATRSSSRSSSTAASTRSACSPRSATRATRSCGRTWRSRPKPGPNSPRTPRLRWHPGRRSAGDPARRGQGQRLPGDRLRPPRPVALHLAPLLRDRRARDRLPHRLARPLPRPGRRRRQPAAGALDGRLALADDRHRRQAGGGDRQRRRLRPLVARSATRSPTRCSRASPTSARCPSTRPASARCGARPPRPRSCARTSAASATSPARSPTPTTTSPTSSPASPPTSALGLPLKVVTISAAGGYDTHADQAADLDRNLRETCEGLLAFQRDLEARGLADRVLVEMWSEFGRRPEENGSARDRPRRRRLRLRDRVESQGRDGRRIPRPGDPRPATTTCA